MADDPTVEPAKLRRLIYKALEPSARTQQGISHTNKFLIVLILLASIVAILATEETIRVRFGAPIEALESIFGIVFIVEYLARLWVAAEDKARGSATEKRLRFIFSLSAMLDMLVILATFLPMLVSNIALLRLIRLFGIFRLAKLGRMSVAISNLGRAVHSRRYELGLTMGLAVGLLIFGAASLYWIEGTLQPEKFGSIPRALWWAVITMTTIGYGDVYPITVLGKLVAALVAIAGIGLIAMPTGILAAAFSDAMQKNDDNP